MAKQHIELLLEDRQFKGIVKCTIPSWTGLAIKVPRSMVNKIQGYSNIENSCVYFLFGGSGETNKDAVYIGQASRGRIVQRLNSHNRDPQKDFWNEAVVFTAQNTAFGQTQITYLEHSFCEMAKEIGRYAVVNRNTPNRGYVTEEVETDMTEFIKNAIVVLNVLGYKLFEPVSTKKDTLNSNINDGLLELHRTIENSLTVEAKGKMTEEGFLVLKGSHISLNSDNTVPPSIKFRKEEAKVELIDKDGVMLSDMLFTSPSYAAMFVIGKSANGLEYWKSNGKSLKTILANDSNTRSQKDRRNNVEK